MSRIFITGSTDGLGKIAAEMLIEQGHRVVIHARNSKREKEARKAIPGIEEVTIGDLASIKETRSLAEQVNALGKFDAIIHNAGVGLLDSLIVTPDGIPEVFAINTLAPYILTALIDKPKRLIYLSSGLHLSAQSSMDDLLWKKRSWQGWDAYSETKLHDVMLAFAVARLWPNLFSNAVDPGWVPTKMGGPGAPDDLMEGGKTQVWLAVSEEPAACVTGNYFHYQQVRKPHPDARNQKLQELLLAECAKISKINLV